MADFGIGEPYLSNLGKNLKGLQDKANELAEMLTLADASEIADKAAFIMASDDILQGLEGDGRESLATKILVQSAIRACGETGEYDYPMFISRLTSAILINANRLFKFNIENKSIKIDLSPLGHADQWIAAANAVRLRFAIGKSRLAKKPIDGMQARYKFWMEKIYKPAREGVPVPEKKRAKPLVLSPQMQKMGRLLRPKVSADQQAKYDKVIRARLAEFQIREAPFWEVINHGNSTMGYGGASAPYPLFGPTNFVDKASKVLTSMLRASIAIYRPKAKEALLGSVVGGRGGEVIDRPTPTPADTKKAIEGVVQFDVNKIRRGEMFLPPGRQTISIVKAIEVTYEIYASSLGNVFVRARGKGGRFIKSLLEIE